jgi:uncharacterized membrane protein YjjP (DUF1212 family)
LTGVSRVADSSTDSALHFLCVSARLLLEYNAQAELVRQEVDRVASHLGVSVLSVVGYRAVTLVAGDGRTFHAQARELRINIAVSLSTQQVIEELCADRLTLDEATRRLETVERSAPRHGRWAVTAIFGLGASALAWLLLADTVATVTSGVSSALGLIARQELGRRHAALFTLPFAAAFVGALLGGTTIRLNLTETPGLCLIVPALMLVPGPHLINAVDDMFDNHMQAGVSRLALAVGILMAAALGVLLGAWLTIERTAVTAGAFEGAPLTLPLDIALAGIAACGFGVFYNAPWRVVAISIVCGMVGHGIRFVLMGQGVTQEVATLFGCLGIGVFAGWAADRLRLPFSAVAFAGAVPMMPGAFIYESIAGAMRMSAAGRAADPALAAATLALFFKAVFVVIAMALGLLAGAGLARLGRRFAEPRAHAA